MAIPEMRVIRLPDHLELPVVVVAAVALPYTFIAALVILAITQTVVVVGLAAVRLPTVPQRVLLVGAVVLEILRDRGIQVIQAIREIHLLLLDIHSTQVTAGLAALRGQAAMAVTAAVLGVLGKYFFIRGIFALGPPVIPVLAVTGVVMAHLPLEPEEMLTAVAAAPVLATPGLRGASRQMALETLGKVAPAGAGVAGIFSTTTDNPDNPEVQRTPAQVAGAVAGLNTLRAELCGTAPAAVVVVEVI